ncbi:succinate dehydrogenase, hydrophobic membrane anchor protein [uncultured Methylobacterium sp.]|jgi:succinate dehydrogenase / fumarate reductase membrane anchor subunit|uniref:succinate dehydrogenase, hydrophobic membrane anchor protein n=1 Tax=uncultured Methylobacterium sp. TaxID=157278 RepID=UPI00262AB282|nr:succinate dehydrogenase, hydrophobic membrane anchor protein [uncultured Methylobacterium sp.]
MPDSVDPSGLTAIRDADVLRRVRHLGSARSGRSEWRLKRLSAVALIPLGLYFVVEVVRLARFDEAGARAWLAQPVPAGLMLLFCAALLAHAFVGTGSIFADYVHGRLGTLVAGLLLRGAVLVLGLAAALSILTIFLGR